MLFSNKKNYFVLAALAIGFIFFLAIPAQASQGDCHLEHCYVPAPTIFLPPYNSLTTSRPDITGLTWKTTIVKVYLDGIELTNIKQIKHADYYGSFWARPNFDLTPGRHFVYTIAYSEIPSEFGQSKESLYIYFDVVQSKPKKVAMAEKQIVADASKQPPENTISEAPVSPQDRVPEKEQTIGENVLEPSPAQALPDNNNEQVEVVQPQNNSDVAVDSGQIEGGVSVEGVGYGEPQNNNEQAAISGLQQAATYEQLGDKLNKSLAERELDAKMKSNRAIGLIMLGALAVILGAWLAVARFGVRHEMYEEKKSELPPIPQAILSAEEGETEWRVPNEQTVKEGPVEPLPEDYWGAAADDAYIEAKAKDGQAHDKPKSV